MALLYLFIYFSFNLILEELSTEAFLSTTLNSRLTKIQLTFCKLLSFHIKC